MGMFSWAEWAILCAAALVGIVCVTPYTLELNREALAKARTHMSRPLWVLILLQNIQGLVLMALATGLGLLIAHSIGLGAPWLEGLLAGKAMTAQVQAMIGPALLLGIGLALIVLLLEICIFWPRLPGVMRTSFPIPVLWKRFLACFYGGIAEELLCRLFLLSLLAWLLGLLWHAPDGRPAVGALWTANILAAVIFGLGHLPTTASLVRLTPLLVTRAILLNGLIGVACGYLFWTYGLEAAMLAHFSADLVLHIPGDGLARLIRAREARKAEPAQPASSHE